MGHPNAQKPLLGNKETSLSLIKFSVIMRATQEPTEGSNSSWVGASQSYCRDVPLAPNQQCYSDPSMQSQQAPPPQTVPEVQLPQEVLPHVLAYGTPPTRHRQDSNTLLTLAQASTSLLKAINFVYCFQMWATPRSLLWSVPGFLVGLTSDQYLGASRLFHYKSPDQT